jgi:hypothetical protein
MKELALSIWAIHIGHIDETGKHPHVTGLVSQLHRGFVCMNEAAFHKVFDDLDVSSLVVTCRDVL